MKQIILFISFACMFLSCRLEEQPQRTIEDFNSGWKFNLGNTPNAMHVDFNDSNWKSLSLPHDWSIEAGYKNDSTVAASTGFTIGGIGWYRKVFTLPNSDSTKTTQVYFEGIYNNSTVWINGNKLGYRPSGYSSFFYDLTPYLNYNGLPNIIAVKVDRMAYADSRWYTGSGIYRNVKLIKTSPLHIKQWGTKISTPFVSPNSATVNINTVLNGKVPTGKNNIRFTYTILDGQSVVASQTHATNTLQANVELTVENPKLWSIVTPNLYTLKTEVYTNGDLVDKTLETFGIRAFKFDADKGFSLNDQSIKLKGVNLHHDAGALGAAVPKAIWAYRLRQLKSIGVNAIRMSHNPHAPELMDLCDTMGFLVMNEAFDEWYKAKGKNKLYIGDNAAKGPEAKAYPTVFNEWAERDLKDLIKRDYNHPSVILWSIGNEIEWTFPLYSKVFRKLNPDAALVGYDYIPVFDSERIKAELNTHIDSIDPLTETAQKLVQWVKQEDTTRPTTCGSVLPSIGMVTGYGKTVDVYGFNYRRSNYDIAHKTYPDLKILGSENWCSYQEWKAVKDRDFVAGIFTWTGFAYIGEAGPWPRKGLNISFFDFGGFKTPCGHFFETLWVDMPKVYMVTTPASESEFSYSKSKGWQFNIQLTPPPAWKDLRLWEWYKVYPKWQYADREPIIVQAYTNCEEAELFLNNTSLGRQKLATVANDDNILKWLVPYAEGELKAVGYNQDKIADTYILKSQFNVANIETNTNKTKLLANGYDVAVIKLQLVDKNGTPVTDADQTVDFSLTGEGQLIGVDNGSELNVQPHNVNYITTHQGRAVIYVQATNIPGSINVKATTKDGIQAILNLDSY